MVIFPLQPFLSLSPFRIATAVCEPLAYSVSTYPIYFCSAQQRTLPPSALYLLTEGGDIPQVARLAGSIHSVTKAISHGVMHFRFHSSKPQSMSGRSQEAWGFRNHDGWSQSVSWAIFTWIIESWLWHHQLVMEVSLVSLECNFLQVQLLFIYVWINFFLKSTLSKIVWVLRMLRINSSSISSSLVTKGEAGVQETHLLSLIKQSYPY